MKPNVLYQNRLLSLGLVVLLLLSFAPTVKAEGVPANPIIAVENGDIITQTSDPHYFSAVGNRLFFAATDGVNDYQLWATDEAATSVVRLKAVTLYSPIITSNGIGFFAAYDGEHGIELWRTDGASAGTQLVADINPGPASSAPYGFVDVNGILFFLVKQGDATSKLWKSDGTAAGTQVVTNRVSPYIVIHVNNKLYLAAGNAEKFKFQLWVSDGLHGPQLWQSDGTTNGTTLMTAIIPVYRLGTYLFATAGNRLFFPAYDDQHGVELWSSDGTDAGTRLVADINQQPDLSNGPIQTFAVVNAGSDRSAHIPINYVNQSQNTQSQVTLTAVLGDGLTYLASSSPVTPTIQDNTLVWQLPDLAPFANGEIDLHVQAPTAPLGTRYPITLTLSTVTSEAAPVQTSATIEIQRTAYTYLPIIQR